MQPSHLHITALKVIVTDRSGTISVGTYDIRDRRNGGLENASRAIQLLGVNIALLQEIKLTGGNYTRTSSGYTIHSTDVRGAHKGGVAYCRDGLSLYTGCPRPRDKHSPKGDSD